jgi:hypothetical protein
VIYIHIPYGAPNYGGAIVNAYEPNPSHDDLLFTTQLLTGFGCLLRLAELSWPDTISLCDYCKVTMCHSIEFLPNVLSFWLPGQVQPIF